jgi:hypothetical protein
MRLEKAQLLSSEVHIVLQFVQWNV